MPKILEEQKAYIIDYPASVELAETQNDVFWTDREIEMEKDLQDLHNNLTEAELHGVITVLKLFTLYELEVGNSYWLDYVRKTFKRPDIQRMAAVFGTTELNTHAPFYNKINEVLNLNTLEFYTSYVEDPVLRNRMEWIEQQFSNKDPLMIAAIGSITEGAILYSNFAFLKHFQSAGKNKLKNLVSGINFSIRDENLHSLGGAWLFRTLRQEMIQECKSEDEVVEFHRYYEEHIVSQIRQLCDQVFEHESRIIDMIFEKGDIKGITAHQMKQFIKSRLNLCLEQLGLEVMYDVEYNPIKEWFYKNIQSTILHDFFDRMGSEYSRDWIEENFVW